MADLISHRPSRLSRRDFTLAGAAGLVALAHPKLMGANRAAATSQACGTLDVELTEGPYYLDRGIYRKRISESRPGLPLQLRLTVLDARSCRPVPEAAVEIWHCDASGLYSGFTKRDPNGPGPQFGGPRGQRPVPPPGGFGDQAGEHPPGPPPFGFHQQHATDNLTFCRGLQLADAQGIVEFETLYPGWYVGRDTHIHLKVHTGGVAQAKYQGGHVVHTGQLFFPDALTDEVADLKPYSARRTVDRVRLNNDMVFADAHGAAVMLTFSQVKSSSLEAGLLATATLHVDPAAIARQPEHWR